MDDWLEYDYEDRNGSWEPLDDAEEFERNQLALDRDWDEPYDGEDEDEDEDADEYDEYWEGSEDYDDVTS